MSMFEPNKVSKLDRSFRRVRKGKIAAVASRNYLLDRGDFGLKVIESCRLTSKQLEAGRRVLVRCLGKKVKLFIRVFPQRSISKKPAETRRGGGKGAHDHWVAIAPAGTMVFEFDGIDEQKAMEAYNLVKYKMPAHTAFVRREI
jgi:large subunit ribosomal protein L16